MSEHSIIEIEGVLRHVDLGPGMWIIQGESDSYPIGSTQEGYSQMTDQKVKATLEEQDQQMGIGMQGHAKRYKVIEIQAS